MHRQWGGDLIGMTCMPEAKLAREAELCYVLVALPTDYDCWRPPGPSRGWDDLLREILENLGRASRNAVKLIHEALKLMDGPPPPCRCREALMLAIWSDKHGIDPAVRRRLEPLIGRHLVDNDGGAT
jgi:5'-methylthioadenosine phosphorylase